MNRFGSLFKPLMWLTALLVAAFAAGCGGDGDAGGGASGSANPAAGTPATVLPGLAGSAGAAATDPTVGSSSPSNGATNVPTSTNTTGVAVTGKQLTATFTQAMDPLTITPAGTFTLMVTNGANVPGTVTMNAANTIATFTPTAAALLPNTNYTATVSTAAMSALPAHTAMAKAVAWTFMTSAALSTGQAPVNLGAAGTFAILTQAGVTDVPASAIHGDVGSSPISGAATLVTCAEVLTGTIFTVAAPGPLPCRVINPVLLTAAVSDMQTAFTDAQGRTHGVGPNLNLGGGTVTGAAPLAPGVYTWAGTPVSITGDLTLTGSANDVWIFQMDQTLALSANKKIILAGGAVAKNVFWQVTGAVTLLAGSHFEGIMLAKTNIQMVTGASANSRLLSQTAVALDTNAVTQPAP